MSRKIDRRLRNRLAKRVLAGKITPAQAWDALGAAGVRNGRNVRAPAARSAPAAKSASAPQAPASRPAVKSAGPDLLKGYVPPGLGNPARPVDQGLLQQYRDHSNPAIREEAFSALMSGKAGV